MSELQDKFNLAEKCISRHWRNRNFICLCLIILLIGKILFLNKVVGAQIILPEQDITETVKFYKRVAQNNEVKIFQDRMPKPVLEEKIRRSILENLPRTVLKLKVENAELTENIKKLFEPILKFYGREKVYNLIIFKHSTPIMFSDTGIVLVISTGMIERAENDDELLGYLAHEIGHEYYAQYSIYSRHLIKLVSENGQEIALNRKYYEAMALIELQCDAFAALTLNAFNYNSQEFVKGLERTGKDFPNHSYGFHPLDSQRKNLVEQIVPETNFSIKPRVSAELIKAKKDCRNFKLVEQ